MFYEKFRKEGYTTYSPNPNVGSTAAAAAGAKPCSTYSGSMTKCKTTIGIRNNGNNGVNLRTTTKPGRCQYNALNKKCY